jgi:hypothetical protein
MGHRPGQRRSRAGTPCRDQSNIAVTHRIILQPWAGLFDVEMKLDDVVACFPFLDGHRSNLLSLQSYGPLQQCPACFRDPERRRTLSAQVHDRF